MAYVTGSASTAANLITAVQNACTANGWTLSGAVLHKGTAYHKLDVISTTRVRVTSGTGIDGSNNLLGIANDRAAMLGRTTTAVAFAYPVTYFIHINASPDEVYVVVKYAATYYQILAFGQSSMPGLVGTGNWSTASANDNWTATSALSTCGIAPASMRLDGNVVIGMFCGEQYFGLRQNGVVHHALDSATWMVEGAWRDWYSPFILQPNTLNQKSILIPIRVYAPRPSGFVSPALECAHARFVNIANLDVESVVTIGPERWKIYPIWIKSASIGAGAFGHALRYDGP